MNSFFFLFFSFDRAKEFPFGALTYLFSLTLRSSLLFCEPFLPAFVSLPPYDMQILSKTRFQSTSLFGFLNKRKEGRSVKKKVKEGKKEKKKEKKKMEKKNEGLMTKSGSMELFA